MSYKKISMYLTAIVAIILMSCTEEDEPCTEIICPDGFSNCIERPCDF